MNTNPIIALAERATPEQRELALDWYAAALRLCRRISRETNVPVRQVAAIMAITSPDAQLSTNVAWTREACRTAYLSRGPMRVGRYPGQMMPKIGMVLRGDVRPELGCSGPKVRPFYRAIMGDRNALVLDRWALRLATGSAATTVANRRAAERIYREAAEHLGLSIRDVQALAWKVARDGMTRKDGTAVKLVDIHDC